MRLVIPLAFFLLASALPASMAQDAALGTPWVANARDNICGVSNPRQITNPAKLDYRNVMAATREMKDLKHRGIDLTSAEGRILRQHAMDRVRRIGSKIMRKNGNCSLWKKISHRDGRRIRDLSTDVIAALNLSRASFEMDGVVAGDLLGADEPVGAKGTAEAPEGGGSHTPILLAIGCGVIALLILLRRTRAAEDVPHP